LLQTIFRRRYYFCGREHFRFDGRIALTVTADRTEIIIRLERRMTHLARLPAHQASTIGTAEVLTRGRFLSASRTSILDFRKRNDDLTNRLLLLLFLVKLLRGQMASAPTVWHRHTAGVVLSARTFF
jgi:hypothetical protein